MEISIQIKKNVLLACALLAFSMSIKSEGISDVKTKATTYTVEVAVQPEGVGTVEGAGSYSENQLVTLKSRPIPNYRVYKWTYTQIDSIVSIFDPYNFRIRENLQITAYFACTDNTLHDLTVDHGTLIPAFSPDISEYTLNVPNNVSEITTIATPNHSTATASGDLGQIPLEVGLNDLEINVKPEHNSESIRTYKIRVIRQSETPSTSADLSSITIEDIRLTPAFQSDITNYYSTVTNNISEIILNATLQDPLTYMEGALGEKPLEMGHNIFKIGIDLYITLNK